MAVTQVTFGGDYERIGQSIQKFCVMRDNLRRINDILQDIKEMLENTAFIGKVGGAIAIAYINQLHPFIENRLAKRLDAAAQELQWAADNLAQASSNAAQQFYF